MTQLQGLLEPVGQLKDFWLRSKNVLFCVQTVIENYMQIKMDDPDREEGLVIKGVASDLLTSSKFALVAQPVEATDLNPVQCGFETCLGHHIFDTFAPLA